MDDKDLTRRDFLRGATLAGVGLAAAACGPSPTPEVKEVEVTKVVKETVVVEATAAPEPTAAPTVVAAKESIVVGMSRPLSGPLAIIGDSAFRPVYETWVPMVNDEGGIFVEEYGSNRRRDVIELCQVNPGQATRLLQLLIVGLTPTDIGLGASRPVRRGRVWNQHTMVVSGFHQHPPRFHTAIGRWPRCRDSDSPIVVASIPCREIWRRF